MMQDNDNDAPPPAPAPPRRPSRTTPLWPGFPLPCLTVPDDCPPEKEAALLAYLRAAAGAPPEPR